MQIHTMFTTDRIIGLLGTTFGIIGIALAIYYGRKSEKVRRPTFSVQEGRDVVIKKVILSFKAFQVLFNNKSLPVEPVVGMWFRFWNSGNLAILRADILKPYVASLPDGCLILDAQIQAVSRDEVGAKLKVDGRHLAIDIALLEPDDGVRVQIIYSGPADANLDFSGVCVGANEPTVLSSDFVRDTPLLRKLWRIIKTLWPILAFAGIASLIGSDTLRKHFPTTMHWVDNIMIVLMCCIVAASVGLFLFWIFNIKSVPRTLTRDS